MEEETYTVQEAARILRTTERTVRRRLERKKDLEGTKDPTTGRWRVKAHSVTAAMQDRPPKASERPLESPESVREYRERVEDLQRELGRLEGRLEITEVAESTLREQLERERERADAERERAEKLQAELDRARLPWYRKLFGS